MGVPACQHKEAKIAKKKKTEEYGARVILMIDYDLHSLGVYRRYFAPVNGIMLE